jgi:hypothetical protein
VVTPRGPLFFRRIESQLVTGTVAREEVIPDNLVGSEAEFLYRVTEIAHGFSEARLRRDRHKHMAFQPSAENASRPIPTS